MTDILDFKGLAPGLVNRAARAAGVPVDQAFIDRLAKQTKPAAPWVKPYKPHAPKSGAIIDVESEKPNRWLVQKVADLELVVRTLSNKVHVLEERHDRRISSLEQGTKHEVPSPA